MMTPGNGALALGQVVLGVDRVVLRVPGLHRGRERQLVDVDPADDELPLRLRGRRRTRSGRGGSTRHGGLVVDRLEGDLPLLGRLQVGEGRGGQDEGDEEGGGSHAGPGEGEGCKSHCGRYGNESEGKGRTPARPVVPADPGLQPGLSCDGPSGRGGLVGPKGHDNSAPGQRPGDRTAPGLHGDPREYGRSHRLKPIRLPATFSSLRLKALYRSCRSYRHCEPAHSCRRSPSWSRGRRLGRRRPRPRARPRVRDRRSGQGARASNTN